MRLLHKVIASPLFLMSAASIAQTSAIRIDDAYGDSFSNYKPHTIPAKKIESTIKQEQSIAPPPPNKKAPSSIGEQKVDVDWLIKNFPILEKRAIDTPTEANLSAYLYAKRVVMDKAQRFEEAHMKVVNEDPMLNENNRIPYASTGAQTIRNADFFAQQQAVKELAEVGGLLAFVDGSCRFCAQQMPILAMLKSNFGMETLVVSIDGKAPKGYKGPLVRDNGLYAKLQLKLSPSVVFVPRPKAYQGEIDPNKYLVIAQGFYAADEMVKLIAFAGHSSKLLSQATMKDLDVWQRGVASTDDLQSLKLDPSKPETFKEKLQPILQKQYQ
ncbi:MAG: hypothetical protein RLY14_1405 [Planctomycetota bacterium]|jgi:conjugal transfer pilus assembly protein TraF